MKSSSTFAAFSPEQRDALALFLSRLHSQASAIEIVFFGVYDIAIGCLIYKSLYLPRWLGLLMAIAGIGWLTALAPTLSAHLSPYVQILGFLAELALMFRLLLQGVDIEHNKEASTAAHD